MTKLVALVIAAFALTFAAPEADAKKRFGGGNSIGQQRAAPAQRQAVPPSKPAQPAQAQPSQGQAAAPANAAPAQQGFMGRWGGMLAGLGIGALLGSLFAGGLGSIGSLLLALLAGVAVFVVVRMLMARRTGPQPAAAAPGASPVAFSGLEPARTENKVTVPPIGGGAGGASVPPIGSGLSAGTEAADSALVDPAPMPPGFQKDAFLRVAKTSFIRLQAANDAGDLDDMRDFTSPEMYAELSMQVKERGAAPQKTEVVSVEAELVEAVVEGDYAVASVRFYGLIREDDARNPEPFDEVWHVRQDQRKRNAPWLISGIQQRD